MEWSSVINIPYGYPYRVLRIVNRDVAEKGPSLFSLGFVGEQSLWGDTRHVLRGEGRGALGLAWQYDVGRRRWETTRVRSNTYYVVLRMAMAFTS